MKKEEEEKEAAPAVEAFNPEENRGMGAGEGSSRIFRMLKAARSAVTCGSAPGAAEAAAHGPVTGVCRGRVARARQTEFKFVGMLFNVGGQEG